MSWMMQKELKKDGGEDARVLFSVVSIHVEDLQAHFSLPLSRAFHEGSDRRQGWRANRKVNDRAGEKIGLGTEVRLGKCR